MNSASRQLSAFLLTLWLATPAYAQVCREPNAPDSGMANMNCDMRYRDTVVACDTTNTVEPDGTPVTGTRPSCPAKPMPMLDTPIGSYMSDYTKYLYIYPRDPKDPALPYAGRYATGTPGDASRTFQMFGNTPPGTKRLASCTTQLVLPRPLAPDDEDEWARFIRLQLDNCTNQYIMNTSLAPFQKENTKLLAMDADPFNPASDLSKKIDLESECQPLRMVRETTNEYSPSEYLRWAWIKTMQNPGARKSTPNLLKCVPCLTQNIDLLEDIPCDREPHLPCVGPGNQGITIDRPLPPPVFPEITLSQLSAVQYEEIIDPTHPFSPRWDFLVNDRDYSNTTMNLATLNGGSGIAVMAAIQLLGRQYMTADGFKGSTFCAGVKKADREADAKKKKDLQVKVDVLEFRRDAYEKALTKRVMYNFVCKKWTAKFPGGRSPAFFVIPASFCFQITGFSIWYPWVFAKDFDCWDCFGLRGDVDDETQHPPCTHNYLGKDLRMKRLPGGLNSFKRDARCGSDMAAVCRDLRKPFTPMNKLKMRYHNPDDKDDPDGKNVVLKDGALEGLTFQEYFGNHMPYPKVWDLGQSLQRTSTADGNDQPPLDTTGQYTAIVGVGREAAAKVASDAAPADAQGVKADKKYTDQRCKTMGWSSVPKLPIRFGGLTIIPPDPMTSWTELKLYQARTIRNTGLSCIARYEKVFKPGSAENMMLMTTGAEWDRTVISKCERGPRGSVKDCTYLTLKEYEEAGSPPDSDTVVYMKRTLNQVWPNAWRGYMAAEDTDNQFPNFGDGDPNIIEGLDEAQAGDIVLLPEGPRGPDAAKPGLAKLALVAEARVPDNSNCEEPEEKNCFVRVIEPDGGKWPDICGTTDTWGEMKSRYYFKPGHLPKGATDEYERIGAPKHCGETKLFQCEQSAWDKLELYRIREDERSGCDKEKTPECAKGAP